MKNIIVLFSLMFTLNFTYSKTEDRMIEELLFTNSSDITIVVKVYPISFIFNGYKNYHLKSRIFQNGPGIKYNFDNCIYLDLLNNLKKDTIVLPPNVSHGLAFDLTDSESGNMGAVAFGKYKIEI